MAVTSAIIEITDLGRDGAVIGIYRNVFGQGDWAEGGQPVWSTGEDAGSDAGSASDRIPRSGTPVLLRSPL
jgi:hypothetical protein